MTVRFVSIGRFENVSRETLLLTKMRMVSLISMPMENRQSIVLGASTTKLNEEELLKQS
jgi:hypothetical protein